MSGETASRAFLEVRDLTVEGGPEKASRPLLSGVSFAIAPGEVLGIVGESGSGKSVLVRSLLLLLPEGVRVARGEILYRGRNLLGLGAAELKRLRGKEIAHLLPDAKSQLNPVLKVGEMMAAVVRAHSSVSRAEADARAAAALRVLGIPDPEQRLKAFPHELSGGIAQRVCIALTLTHEPSLIVADEPTAGLDVTVQRQVLDIMSATIKDRQTAQLIVTRDLGIVAHYCDRVAVMQAGQIVESARTLDLFDSPQHPYTKRLLRAVRATRRRARISFAR